MAFERQQPITPESIGDLEIILFLPDPATGAQPAARGSVEVRMSDGSTIRLPRDRNIEPHLTGPERTALLNFLNTLRQRAIDEILPEVQP